MISSVAVQYIILYDQKARKIGSPHCTGYGLQQNPPPPLHIHPRKGGRGESWTTEKERGATEESTRSQSWVENTNMTERMQETGYLQSTTV